MPHAGGDGMQQQWPAGDRLPMTVWFNQPDEDVPPIVKQRNKARSELAAGKVLCYETAPAPLVF